MKKKTIAILLILVLAIGAGLTLWHFSTRAQVPDNALRVEFGGAVTLVAVDTLTLEPVEGMTLNGKGEEKPVSGMGVPLSDVLTQAGAAGYATVTVTADDAYSAQLTAEEVAEEGKAYLLVEEDDSLRLVVFGDSNSKRKVSNVKVVAAQ